MTNRKTALIAAIVALVGAGAIGAGTTLAAEESRKSPEFVSELVEAIAEKFELDPEAVREVFEEAAAERREERREEREERLGDLLSRAVAGGEITQAQSDAARVKLDEMRAAMDALRDADAEERREELRDLMEELRAWGEENDVPMRFLRVGPPMGRMHGGEGMGPRGHGSMGMMRGGWEAR